MTRLASAWVYVEPPQQGKLSALLNFNPIETYTAIPVVCSSTATARRCLRRIRSCEGAGSRMHMAIASGYSDPSRARRL